ncbi:MAG TPA: hypothetical protein HPP51_00755 [Planctomycetes bacterium]|nr:hypothetical protein [Planctomycetota bacterium]
MPLTMQVLMVLLSAAATAVSTLVLWYLRAINRQVDLAVARIVKLEDATDQLRQRKQDCQNEFISQTQFLRETGYTRKQLDELVQLVKHLEGKFDVVEKMPEIAGQIASQTVKQMLEYQKNVRAS